MKKVDIDYINTKLIEENCEPIKLQRVDYNDVISNGSKLLDKEGNEVGTNQRRGR